MIELRLLGSSELRGSGGEEILSVLAQPKRMALLAYLAVAPPRGYHRRDELLGVFWPESDQEHARAALRKALFFLRRSLGEEVIGGRGEEEVGLDWERIRCDVAEFEAALQADDAEKAVGLYRGDLLPGFFLSNCPEFERWLDAEREYLREAAAHGAWEAAHRCLAVGRVGEGERMAEYALSLAVADESEVQRFMKAIDAAGDRAAALRIHRKFAKRLAAELDLTPSPQTQAVAESIRSPSKTPDASSESASEPSPPREEPSLLAGIREALADRYAVQAQVGTGGMAAVFVAQDLRHNRKVAIKVLNPDVAAVVGSERFLREIEIVAGLVHPHILPLHDSGEVGGYLYYVMPFVEGESLRSRLETERRLPIADALAITREIADALGFAHRRGVVHRDVKPDNILLVSGHAVLADFGIAHATTLAGAGTRTRTGVSLGTPSYMSPEQITGESRADARSDQYGLACVLYEMLAGVQPFEGPTADMTARLRLSTSPKPVIEARPSVPRGVSDAIARGMAWVPEGRFEDIGEFSKALGEGIVRPEAPRGQYRRRSSLVRLAATGLALGGLATAAVFLFRCGQEPPLPLSEPASSERVVAMMPSTVLGDEGSGAIGEALATLLALRLDDVEGLRTVDRHVLIPYVAEVTREGRLSLADARRTAERFGATDFAILDPVGIGGDRVSATVTLYSHAAGHEPAGRSEIHLEGSTEDLLALADGLAVSLLDALDIAPDGRLATVARLTTDSRPALSDYLEGEREFRATRYEEAYQAFAKAAEADPAFALAHYRESVAGMLALRFQEARLAADRARNYQERLTDRDRSLLLAWAQLIEGSPDAAESSYRAILLEYPDDVEAHFGLGEVLVYYNPVRGRSPAEAEPELLRVLELAPDFGQARFHLLEFATQRRDRPTFDSLFAGVDLGSDQALAWQAVRAYAWGDAEDRQRIRTHLQVADPIEGGLAVARVAAFLQDYAAAEELAALLSGPERDRETRGAARILGGLMRLARGRYEAGLEALKEAAQLTPEWALELETLYAGLPFRSPEPAELKVLGASLQGWDAGQAPSSTNFVLFAHNGFHRHLRLYLLGLTSVWAGDPERAGQYASELRRSSRTAERSVITAAWAQSIRARVAVAQDRPSEAVDLLTMYRPDIPLELISISPFFSASMDRYELARLLEELDRPDEALAWYRSLTEGHELVLVAPGHLGMARILEARGDRVGAAEHYRRFADLWQDCEPQLRVLVEDARERAVRLGDGL